MHDVRTVWVLGAGFSRSLGGPLLTDLFRQEMTNEIGAFFPPATYPDLVNDIFATQAAYNWGLRKGSLWSDAEQFLVFVDDAYSGSAAPKRERLRHLANDAHAEHAKTGLFACDQQCRKIIRDDLQRAARRAIAAETSRFLMTPPIDEMWHPYREWAKGLRPEWDSVITFNYDLVLERLGAQFSFPLPADAAEPNTVPVFKLHGSADWQRADGNIVRGNDVDLLYDKASMLAIATPGRSKAPLVNAPFETLWTRAATALSNARRVVFVGYRFPPTDTLASWRIRSALAEENSGGKVRRFETVLGPKTDSDDSRRLHALLRAAKGHRHLLDGEHDQVGARTGGTYLRIVQYPLWAEDFLAVHRQLARDEAWQAY